MCAMTGASAGCKHQVSYVRGYWSFREAACHRSRICICTPSSRCWMGSGASTITWSVRGNSTCATSLISDHGVMYGVVDWYKAARKHELSPVIGMEAYLAPGSLKEREKSSYHLLLLAQNERGYRNLLKLASRASLEGFDYKPRVDLDMLNSLRDGLICTSACLGGPLANNFLEGRDAEAERYARSLREVFGPQHFYVELQDHGLAEQQRVNTQLIELAQRAELPLVATNDSITSASRTPRPRTSSSASRPTATSTIPSACAWRAASTTSSSRGDGACSASCRKRWPNTAVIAERCNLDLRFDRLIPAPGPSSPRTRPPRVPDAHLRADLGALPPAAPRGRGAPGVRVRGHREDRLRRLTCCSSGISCVTPATRASLGPRGSAAGSIVLYMPGDQRHRPDGVRPDLRALPEPRTPRDAGYRHGLCRQSP